MESCSKDLGVLYGIGVPEIVNSCFKKVGASLSSGCFGLTVILWRENADCSPPCGTTILPLLWIRSLHSLSRSFEHRTLLYCAQPLMQLAQLCLFWLPVPPPPHLASPRFRQEPLSHSSYLRFWIGDARNWTSDKNIPALWPCSSSHPHQSGFCPPRAWAQLKFSRLDVCQNEISQKPSCASV